MLKKLRYYAEAIPVTLLYFLFYLLPIELSSSIGGRLLQAIGPLTSAHKTAGRNLAAALPHLSTNRRKEIIKLMWNNLGRIIGELPHFAAMSRADFDKRVQVYIDPKINIRNAIIVSAHYGNWEIYSNISKFYKLKMHTVYRPLNNPYVDNLFKRIRLSCGSEGLIPKGNEGVRMMLKALERGDSLGLLVDQKMSTGVKSQLFGMEAMTSNIVEKLHHKGNYPIIMTYVKRLAGAKYQVFFYKLPITSSDDRNITQAINDEMEEWITKHPEMWFWVHNRWG